MVYRLFYIFSLLIFTNSLAMEIPGDEHTTSISDDGWVDKCAQERLDQTAIEWRNLFNPQKNKEYRDKWDNYCQIIQESKMAMKQFNQISSQLGQVMGPVEEKTAEDIYPILRSKNYQILEKIGQMLTDMKKDIDSQK